VTDIPHESTVNVCLSEILNDILGPDARVIPETATCRAGKKRRFDIKIEYRGIEYILEASFDKKDAVRDAIHRIEEGLIDTIAIAVYYEPSYFIGSKTVSEIKEILLKKPLEMRVFAQGLDISRNLLRYIYTRRRV